MNREFEPYSETVVMAEVAEWRTPSVSRSWIRYAAVAIIVLLLAAIARGSFTASSRTISEKALVRAYLQDITYIMRSREHSASMYLICCYWWNWIRRKVSQENSMACA